MPTYLPNLFIPGAQKSGSTSLASFIGAHRQCLLSEPKENGFFCRADNLADLDLYRSFFQSAEGEAPRIVADATTAYMPDPKLPRLIAAFAPTDPKFIFILRSPAARTYSAYLHLYKRGHERRRPEAVFLGLGSHWSEAVAEEQRRLAEALHAGLLAPDAYRPQYDDFLWAYRYLGNSAYREQIERYEATFGPERVLTLCFEAAIADPAALKRRLADFLDVDEAGFADALPRENTTKLPKPTLRARVARVVKHKAKARDIEPVPLKPEPEIAEALKPLFVEETAYWSERMGMDLPALGW